MIPSVSRVARFVALLAIVACLPSGYAASAPAAACRADLTGTYRTEEVFSDSKDKIFVVQITSDAPCANVYFDLVTTERLFDGEQIKLTTPMWRKVTAGAESAFKVRFKMAKDSELTDWKINYTRCEACGS